MTFALIALVLAGTYAERLERNLKENIVAFWYPRTLDRANGGYIINHDAKGAPNPQGPKMIVTQSRQVWLFSRLARDGYQPKEMLAAAEHGFRFLRERMWDQPNGGFYWEVDATGKPVQPKKHMYGQSFALYGLSEYYSASKNEEARKLADRLFALFEKHAYDKEFGGYREWFNQDWSAPPEKEVGYMGVPRDIKLMNTHLHLLESVTAYYRATKSPIARERLLELIRIESNAVVRKDLTACTDRYQRNWTPLPGRVSYGHDLENIWLLMDAMDAVGMSNWPLADLYRRLFDYSMKYGYDAENGGFFDSGEFNKPANNRQKTWWVQAEAAVSALYMYRLTGDRAYYDVFAKTCDFIDKYQTDWQNGEWHPVVSPDLKPSGRKADRWKAGYHNGRAMLECLKILRTLER
jgi:mannobiose 2-epimerase